ncbi:cytidine deaminase [Orenia marismortui]|uniref:Cytidine deaminase n=1 Tax=Orenia marismortui TaxID=46469 RepID=A0A4R8GZS0_9FIRM|nr:cytidine deaminase [Orenia marismortui]TDX52375.1 cytidine deaminase [Orenia marismortui]
MKEELIQKLVKEAKKARENAYVPYSEFRVGAAVLTKDGKVHTGCNVENSSYGLSNCAERTAIFKAISEGEIDFEAIAIVADTDRACPPCGACRQVIVEFGKDIDVIMSNLTGDIIIKKADDLLWGSFSNQDLG